MTSDLSRDFDAALAKQIIEKTGPLFPFPVSICDINGFIIASTTSERVGYYHEGSALMFQNNWDEIAVSEENRYKGTKKGVSRPLRLNGTAIGSIGLTGEVEKVAGYSKLLQSFAELLIENFYAGGQVLGGEQSLQSFVTRWLSPAFSSTKQAFINHVQKFGFNWSGGFSIAVIIPSPPPIRI